MFLKFIGFVALCAVFIVFIVSNLENKCNVSFGPANLVDVPVFLTVFTSFVLGLLVSVPVAISIRFDKNRKRKEVSRPAKRAGKNRAKDAGTSREGAAREEEDGAYGID